MQWPGKHISTLFACGALVLLTPSLLNAQCISTGALAAGSASNNAATGSVAWTNATGIASSDNDYSSSGVTLGILSSATSNYLVATAFGFSVPATATICGIEARIERRASGGGIGASVQDNIVRLVRNGSLAGSNLASATNWGGSDAVGVYGSASGTWGSSWTPADINSASFGLAFSAQYNSGLLSLGLGSLVDNITLTVYYQLPPSTLPVQMTSFSGKVHGATVLLEWETLSEDHNDHFEVQKLADDTWQNIEWVKGMGTTSKKHNYQAFDSEPGAMNYYRIRQVDVDGSQLYSDIVAVEYTDADLLTVFPVPCGNELNLKSRLPAPEKVELYTAQGLLLGAYAFDPRSSLLRLNLEKVPPGLLLLRAYYPGGQMVQKKVLKSLQAL